jgi:hypothetical protein
MLPGVSPGPVDAATVLAAWTAPVGSAGANGKATVQLLTTGTGSIAVRIAKMRPATTLPAVVSAGTCASPGTKLVSLASIRTTISGTATKTWGLTAAQSVTITRATGGTGRIAIRIGSITTGGVKCGVFAITLDNYLPMWVDNYTHAFGGQVTVNGQSMDAAGLTTAIRANPDAFTQVKQVAGVSTSFLVVNGTPLATRVGTGRWTEATLGTMGDLNGVTFEFASQENPPPPPAMIERIHGRTVITAITGALDISQVFQNFTQSDWARVINNWTAIESSLSKNDFGSLPYPFYWYYADQTIKESRILFANAQLQFRAQGLLRDLIPLESLRALKDQMHYSNDDMLKLLEFTVRTRVLRYPEVAFWDVEDEICDSYVQASVNGLLDYNFWGIATGLTPAQLTLKVAGWVKQDRPAAMTYMTEATQFDTANPTARWAQDYFTQFIQEVAQGNTKAGHKVVDGLVGEDNWWIFEPQDWTKIGESIDQLARLGFKIGSSETIIVTGDVPINGVGDPGRVKLVQITDRDQAQAQMYAEWLRLYLDKGIKVIGFAGLGDDYNAWPNLVGLMNTNPFFFDQTFRAKQSYYSMIAVLYQRLP